MIFPGDLALASKQNDTNISSAEETQEAELIPQLEIAPDPTDIYEDSASENQNLEISPLSKDFK